MTDTPRPILQEARSILEQHVGKDNAITSQELSERLGGLDTLDSTPNTRAVIRDVMEAYQLPIAGSSDGYYIVSGPDEYTDAMALLNSRIDGIRERQQLLAEAWQTNAEAFSDVRVTELGDFNADEGDTNP